MVVEVVEDVVGLLVVDLVVDTVVGVVIGTGRLVVLFLVTRIGVRSFCGLPAEETDSVVNVFLLGSRACLSQSGKSGTLRLGLFLELRQA